MYEHVTTIAKPQL